MREFEYSEQDAPSWVYQVLLLEALREITFIDPSAEKRVPKSGDITIYKSLRAKNENTIHGDVEKPAILLAYSGSSTDPRRGTNYADDVDYTYQVLILDTDFDKQHRGARCWQKWQDQIMRKFRHQDLNRTLIVEGKSEVALIQVSGFNAINDVDWDVRDEFRAGVQLVLTARETRG